MRPPRRSHTTKEQKYGMEKATGMASYGWYMVQGRVVVKRRV